ncbi:hypothetical protein EYF80_028902 [Liparis tanakae]|uniref:Uncharacterized protein n=1 Tax=Liparis tanakae TaxID=230148 RepID=A0A4Z2H4W7_9TELE|nr:hypothetical protein EYF80_028902 [Liparis tanakae]
MDPGQTHEELVPPLGPGRQVLLVAGDQLAHLLWRRRRGDSATRLIWISYLHYALGRFAAGEVWNGPEGAEDPPDAVSIALHVVLQPCGGRTLRTMHLKGDFKRA